MADELNKDAEFGGKHKDEEDPILVAQRYLNIFHQIHIFNARRQKEFDDSLLLLSSDIRILLSTLPGGSVLLDHITELEDKRGITLLTELEKANIKESKNKKNKSKQKEEQAKQNTQEGNMSSSILRLLKQSEDKHEQDMRVLTDAFIQSQTNMANILKEILQAKQVPATTDTSQEEPIEQKGDIAREESSERKDTKEKEIKEKEGPKLFGLTKKLFGTVKEKKHEYREDDIKEDGPRLGDATPVSLDDIEDAPVVLDEEQIIAPIKEVQQKKAEAKEAKPIENVPQNNEKTNSSDDWEWEYVDEEDDDDSDDGDWEYIEVPEDEVEIEPVAEPAPAPTPTPTPELKSTRQSAETVQSQEPAKIEENVSQEAVQEVIPQMREPAIQETIPEEVQTYDNQAYDESMFYDGQEQYYDPNGYAENYELSENYNPQLDAYLAQGDYQESDDTNFERFMVAEPVEGYDDDVINIQDQSNETSK